MVHSLGGGGCESTLMDAGPFRDHACTYDVHLRDTARGRSHQNGFWGINQFKSWKVEYRNFVDVIIIE